MEVNRRLNSNTQLSSIHRSHGKPTRRSLATICWFLPAAEADGTNGSRVDSITFQCSPVGDSEGYEERRDDLFNETIGWRTSMIKSHEPGSE